MKISTKGRYALRILLDLAEHSGVSNVSVRQIAERQNISEKYLEGIIAKLHHSGLVQSVRGKYGGYRLAKAAEEYTMFEILSATEDSMAIVACLDSNNCTRGEECSTVAFWCQLQNYVHNYLKNVTLQNIIDGDYKALDVENTMVE